MTNPLCIALRELSDDWNETCGSPMMASKVCREAAEEIERLQTEWDGAAALGNKLLAEAVRLRAALERIDAHLEVRPGDPLENLQVIDGYGNSIGFWLALKDARKVLRTNAHEPEKTS